MSLRHLRKLSSTFFLNFPYLLYHNFHSYNSESSPLDILSSSFGTEDENQFLLKKTLYFLEDFTLLSLRLKGARGWCYEEDDVDGYDNGMRKWWIWKEGWMEEVRRSTKWFKLPWTIYIYIQHQSGAIFS